jgi:hypothetical protein
MTNIFSVHNAVDGSVVLYLEETDANLDLLEDIVAQVPLFHIAQIRDHSNPSSMKEFGASPMLDKVRQKVPSFVTRIAAMTEEEAVSLAEALLESVQFARAIDGRPVNLHLVK